MAMKSLFWGAKIWAKGKPDLKSMAMEWPLAAMEKAAWPAERAKPSS